MRTIATTAAFGSRIRRLAAALAAAAALWAGAQPAQAMTDAEYRAWQVERALHPSPAQLERERAGKVYIYDGLTEADIERILEEAFDRVDAMMFVRVQVEDPDTGELVALDDGC